VERLFRASAVWMFTPNRKIFIINVYVTHLKCFQDRERNQGVTGDSERQGLDVR
jgi:hypothetical protein